MTEVTLHQPTAAMLFELSQNLDEADTTEIVSSTGKEPFQCLLESVDISLECFCVKLDGKVIGIFGCAGTYDIEGFPWGFFTEALRVIPATLLRGSLDYVEKWQEEFGVLKGYVHADNKRAIRFIEWLGFEFDVRTRRGLFNSVFKEFYRV